MDLDQMAKRFAILRELKDYHKACETAIGAEMQSLGLELFNAFVEKQTAEIKISGDIFKDKKARNVKPSLDNKVTVVDQEALHRWLRGNLHGDLVKPYVFPATLLSFVNAQLEAKQPLPNDSVIKVFTIHTANVRRV